VRLRNLDALADRVAALERMLRDRDGGPNGEG